MVSQRTFHFLGIMEGSLAFHSARHKGEDKVLEWQQAHGDVGGKCAPTGNI